MMITLGRCFSADDNEFQIAQFDSRMKNNAVRVTLCSITFKFIRALC
jgi:hypothetical protein